MQIRKGQLKKFFIDSGMLSEEKLNVVEAKAKKEGLPIEDILVRDKFVTEQDMGKAKAYTAGIPYVNLKDEEIDPAILEIIPEQMARQYNAISFAIDDEKLKVAMLDPNDLLFIDFIGKKTGMKIVPCLADAEGITKALKLFQKSLKAEFGALVGSEVGDDGERLIIKNDGKSEEAREENEEKEDDLKKAAEDLPVVKIVDTLLKHAILEGASDIHVEPEEKDVVTRFRIDGVLHDAMTLPRIILPGIVARIKVLANLKIDEHRLPQDGRFKVESPDYKVAFRVSIIPVFDGEKVVMRLLNESSGSVLTLDQMGFRKRDHDILQAEIEKPNGMILVVGPTGSGKTTTLYTILGMLNEPGVNISTLEDPIEYRMARVNQSQINAKINFTFASGLRALLRQDPDIIMVGEIRDGETAELAVHAALTGHLVLSTLHTSSAAGTLPRITDMGIENFMIASTANVIISQRLVRKNCKECTEECLMDEGTYKGLSRKFDVERLANVLREEMGIKEEIKDVKDFWMNVKFKRGKGCSKCRNGYKGRMGIYEVLQITDELKRLINAESNAEIIEQEGVKEGMNTMLEDGIIKAAQGVTTLEEVMRVTKE
ncbi:MAG: GspE/PulE family protein [Candidatus Pacebacteria bacterium]|nr:GspE/PulE family protein [Candidatus Paceibacterota bacterium]